MVLCCGVDIRPRRSSLVCKTEMSGLPLASGSMKRDWNGDGMGGFIFLFSGGTYCCGARFPIQTGVIFLMQRDFFHSTEAENSTAEIVLKERRVGTHKYTNKDTPLSVVSLLYGKRMRQLLRSRPKRAPIHWRLRRAMFCRLICLGHSASQA